MRKRLPDDPAAEPVVRLVDVGKTYGGSRPVPALRGVHLTIGRGEHVAITGPSGSGKSTLLNLLGLLDVPTSGEYHLDGSPTSALSERERCAVRAHMIGFVFQSFHLVAYRSAVENVEAGLLYQRIGRRERRRRAVVALEAVGLVERMWATPPELSGGERQRVAIARAVVRRPAVVLCDEPTGNLDSANGAHVLDLITGLHRDGMTIVVITHDPLVSARAERTVVINDGVVAEPVAPSRRSWA